VRQRGLRPLTHQQSILSASRSIEFTFPFKLKFFIPKINSISLSERIGKVGGRDYLNNIITVNKGFEPMNTVIIALQFIHEAKNQTNHTSKFNESKMK